MEESVRRAAATDIEALVTLYRAGTEELQSERGGDVWARHTGRPREEAAVRAQLMSVLADEEAAVFAGTLDDVVVGYAVVRTVPLIDGTRLADVSDIYVEPGAREVGIGELMLDAAIAHAEAQGCFGIDSIALPGMRETKNFFETAGLVARAIVVHKRLR